MAGIEFPCTFKEMHSTDMSMDVVSFPPFDSLKTSTKTTMVYTNFIYCLDVIKEHVVCDHDRATVIRNKSQTIVSAPRGCIFSVQKGSSVRGVDMKKKVKKRLEREVGENALVLSLPNGQSRAARPDYFLNQVSIFISMGEYNVHLMFFSDNVKIAGCKQDCDALDSIRRVWDSLLQSGQEFYKLKHGETEPRLVFEGVMRNVGFSLGLELNREEIVRLFNNSLVYDADVVGGSARLVDCIPECYLAQFETTEHKSANIKFHVSRQCRLEHECECLYPLRNTVENIKLPPKDESKEHYTSLLVFASSKVILSGKYDKDMAKTYEFFYKTVLSHRDAVIERIHDISSLERNKFLSILGV